jgi:hypothetical protein
MLDTTVTGDHWLIGGSPDVPLLRKTVEWVEEQEALTESREWDQGSWYAAAYEEPWCGTVYCVAGKIALDHGWKPCHFLPEAENWVKDGEVRDIEELASEILGLRVCIAERSGFAACDPDQHDQALFHGDNTAADVRRIAERIAGERL